MEDIGDCKDRGGGSTLLVRLESFNFNSLRLLMKISIFQEARKRMPREQGTELSKLVKWSEASGAMWAHSYALV